jgi:hypothetical protein
VEHVLLQKLTPQTGNPESLREHETSAALGENSGKIIKRHGSEVRIIFLPPGHHAEF